MKYFLGPEVLFTVSENKTRYFCSTFSKGKKTFLIIFRKIIFAGWGVKFFRLKLGPGPGTWPGPGQDISHKKKVEKSFPVS